MDLCGPLPTGHNLLVIVDYYSRFIEVEIMTKIDSAEIIKRLEVIFARFGFPLSITADNGRQFISEEFKQYCDVNNTKLISTTPYWPQQNGQVERQNRSLLKTLVISQNTKGDWRAELQKYLLAYRSTAHSVTGVSPAAMMFGREIRDKLPSIHQPIETDSEIRDRDAERKEKGKEYERRGAKPIQIEEGDRVLVKRQIKENKLQSMFEPTEFVVVRRQGAEVTVESTVTKKLYRRNVAHVQRIPVNSSSDRCTENADSSTPTGTTTSDLAAKRPTEPSSSVATSQELEWNNRETELPLKRMRKAPQRYGDLVMDISQS